MPIFQVFFISAPNLCAKKRKFEPIGLILFLKNIFFAKAAAETWQKHILTPETYQMKVSLKWRMKI